jgi:hypothetical protein
MGRDSSQDFKLPVPPDFTIDVPVCMVEWLRAQQRPAQPSIEVVDANGRQILTGRLLVDDDGRLVVDDDGSKTGMAKCRLKAPPATDH